jgi:adenylate kinase
VVSIKKEGHGLFIAVTGTPGAGKSTFAKEISDDLGITLIEINSIVESYRLFSETDDDGAKIAMIKPLTKKIKQLAGESLKNGAALIVGHLACELGIRYDIAIVVRCQLEILEQRLLDRGYGTEKLKENLMAEALDYCGVAAQERSDEVLELDGSADKDVVIDYLKARIEGKPGAQPKLKQIDRMPELLKFIEAGKLP